MANSSRIASIAVAAVLTLSSAAGIAGAADADSASETLQPLPTVETPKAPASGSLGSSSRVPKACQKLDQQIEEVRKQWDDAVAEQDIYKANGLRMEFGNLAASYYQCRLAGNTLAGSL
ncbi:hypothetical protein COJE103337_03340 [Corynebacterium jeikeium]|jgi:crotonobetainyl-CoA:carnitine CoA-transferase CaiB-like acyl-CoA transferase|uniref:hypothetical protein n=1 Tax=Corynebacterium jeikeium TaxID=38289 RepID=UPI0002F432F2|nr:hypothetical protein [Corynebacterium jeikeium]OOD30488.1 hypothetical protein BWP03_07250 [Corynebacterium jeikeium]WCZ53392.1 hypothetical protein CJEIK_04360 [Corynebacterium jeikeium]SUY81297.1 Uncharacterised protein [Corynebacterium jeikeium]SUY85653.1 Uncharacterised protein [Corynebacterium jeikeium]